MQILKQRRAKSKSPMFSPMNEMLYQTSAFCSADIASRKARWKHENTKSNCPPNKQQSPILQ